MIYLTIAYVILTLITLYFTLFNHKSKVRFLVKMATCLGYIILAIFNMVYNVFYSAFSIGILIALILSFLGDIFLGLRHLKVNKLTDLLGFVFFILAQITYSISFIFLSNTDFSIVYVIAPIIGFLLVLLAVKLLHLKDKFRIKLMLIYSIFVFSMCGASIGFYLDYSTSSYAILALLGGIIFTISDYTLLFKYFYKGNKTIKLLFTFITTITYFTAQLLFIYSMH